MTEYAYIISILIVVFGTINIIRMVFFMVGSDIYTFRHLVSKKKIEHYSFKRPKISVVIPAHNEENTIIASVESVLKTNYPKEKLEIIVVDDGSTDATYALTKQYISLNNNHSVKIVYQKNSGKAHALNNGIKNYSTGELVMCLDADSTIHPDALINAARYFADPNVVALASNVKIRRTGTLYNLIQAYEYLVCYQMKRAQTVFNIEYIIGGIGSMFRRSALEKVGYYDTDTITEDIDLTMKFIQLGNKKHRIIYGSDVIAYTESVLDLGGLIRQRYRWKYGRTQTFIKNSSLFLSRNKKNNQWLTRFYLPFAIFSDIAFFFEPFMVTFIIFVIFRYRDLTTFLSAVSVISVYFIMNVLAEDTLSFKEKLKLGVLAPSMYFFFYLLSFVEYLALIKTYVHFHKIPKTIGKGICGWQHVERAKA